jgi:hypothetical protein
VWFEGSCASSIYSRTVLWKMCCSSSTENTTKRVAVLLFCSYVYVRMCGDENEVRSVVTCSNCWYDCSPNERGWGIASRSTKQVTLWQRTTAPLLLPFISIGGCFRLSLFFNHTQRYTTVGRTPLDEWVARRRDLYRTTHNTHNRQASMPPGGIRTHNISRRVAADLRLDRAAIGTGGCHPLTMTNQPANSNLGQHSC